MIGRAGAREAADLPDRLRGLAEAAELSDGRIAVDVVTAAHAVVARAGERLRLSAEHTVVALAGATGSGKSSLFNALAGLELSPVGVRRPTTASPHACVWGPEGAGPLLAWLRVPRRHQVSRETVLDGDRQAALHGLVLLDLPDHDSTELDHRLEVDRLVELVDLLIWVVDPQKYADALLHERYLRPLARHAEVTVLVLNKIDTLTPAQVEQCSADLGRLLVADGLSGVPVLNASARTGAGIEELRTLLADAVRRRAAVTARVAADVDRASAAVGQELGGSDPEPVGRKERKQLVESLENAAGVPSVVDAVSASYRSEAIKAAGWPVTRWLRRLRPDPLRRLHLGSRGSGTGRSSLPEPTPVVRAQVDGAVRRLVETAATGMPPAWADAVRRAARGNPGDLADALDSAVVGTDLGTSRRPSWWGALRVLQWIFLGFAAIGALWLTALMALDYFRLPSPESPSWGRVPLPTLLLLGGVLCGLLLAAASRVFGRVGGRRRAHRAARRLRERVAVVAAGEVLDPVDAELERYRQAKLALRRARGGR